MDSIKLKENQTIPFMSGLLEGVTGFALQFDNRHNRFYKKYESAAYDAAYNLSQSEKYQTVWQSTPDYITSEKWMLKYSFDAGYIVPDGWELYMNNLNRSITIETIEKGE